MCSSCGLVPSSGHLLPYHTTLIALKRARTRAKRLNRVKVRRKGGYEEERFSMMGEVSFFERWGKFLKGDHKKRLSWGRLKCAAASRVLEAAKAAVSSLE